MLPSFKFRSRNWFVFLCMFSVLCLWQCNSLVRTPYCALLMPHSCCQSQGVRLGQKKETSTGHGRDMSFCYSSLIQLRQSLQVAHSITFYVPLPGPHFLCVCFFCVFCTPYFALLMAQVCREYWGWGLCTGRERTSGPEVQQLLSTSLQLWLDISLDTQSSEPKS